MVEWGGRTMVKVTRTGRVNALSNASGKLVAAMTMTPLFCSKPSISTSSWLSVIFIALCSFKWREPPMASISSMKMMHGDFCFAASNKSRTRRAPTPTYLQQQGK